MDNHRLCEALRNAGYLEDSVLGGVRRFRAVVPFHLEDYENAVEIYGKSYVARQEPYDIFKNVGMKLPIEDEYKDDVLAVITSSSRDDFDDFDWTEYLVLVRD